MLRLEDVYSGYDKTDVLKGISLEVGEGEIITLIGANGAGKSTLLLTLSGLLDAKRGTVSFEGVPIHNRPPHQIVERGISHVPEGRHVLNALTVLENLELGAYLRRDPKGVASDVEDAYAMFPILKRRKDQLAGTLSGGEQQMLAIARGLMARPKLLMLDEPSLGLAPKIVSLVFEKIRQINERGVTVLLVEQNASMALQIADRGYVIETGRIILEGRADALSSDAKVRAAYLGL